MTSRRKPNSSPPIAPKEIRLHWTLITEPAQLVGKEILWAGSPERAGNWHSEEQALLLVLSEQCFCILDTDWQELLRFGSPHDTPRMDELLSPCMLHALGLITDRQRAQMDGWDREQRMRELRVDIETSRRMMASAESELAALEKAMP